MKEHNECENLERIFTMAYNNYHKKEAIKILGMFTRYLWVCSFGLLISTLAYCFYIYF